MPPHNVVIGQKVDPVKVERAKELRRQMTPDARTLWEHLRRTQLAGYHFRREQVLYGFIVDFYCHTAALVVEVDGGIHEEQKDYDVERDRILTERGFCVLRVTNEQVQGNLDTVLDQIRAVCNERT
jgi:very-short-patch-repair endonuclease